MLLHWLSVSITSQWFFATNPGEFEGRMQEDSCQRQVSQREGQLHLVQCGHAGCLGYQSSWLPWLPVIFVAIVMVCLEVSLSRSSYNLMEKLHRLHNRSVFFDSEYIKSNSTLHIKQQACRCNVLFSRILYEVSCVHDTCRSPLNSSHDCYVLCGMLVVLAETTVAVVLKKRTHHFLSLT